MKAAYHSRAFLTLRRPTPRPPARHLYFRCAATPSSKMKPCCISIKSTFALVILMETDNIRLDAVRTMNKEAMVEIFDLYSSALYNYVLRLCGDPMLADQIVGDVFARLLDQLAAGKGPTSNLRSYLYETAYHRIIDETRYVKRSASLESAAWLPQDHQSAFLRLENEILFREVLHVIQHKLTDDQRHVIVLRFMEEFSLRETAAILGKRVEHIKVIQGRAIAALRQALERQAMGRMRRISSSPMPRKIPQSISQAVAST